MLAQNFQGFLYSSVKGSNLYCSTAAKGQRMEWNSSPITVLLFLTLLAGVCLLCGSGSCRPLALETLRCCALWISGESLTRFHVWRVLVSQGGNENSNALQEQSFCQNSNIPPPENGLLLLHPLLG